MIHSATLRFKSLRNYNNASNRLYVQLLDTAPEGVRWYWDNQGGGNNFAGQGTPLVTYQNLTTTPLTREHDFDTAQLAALNSYMQNGGDFALGIDPDCHFYNCGVELDLECGVIPEPASVGVLAIGAVVALLRRRRKQ